MSFIPVGPPRIIRPFLRPREDNVWMVGEFVAYRCSDCLDRWDIQLTIEDLHDPDDAAVEHLGLSDDR